MPAHMCTVHARRAAGVSETVVHRIYDVDSDDYPASN